MNRQRGEKTKKGKGGGGEKDKKRGKKWGYRGMWGRVGGDREDGTWEPNTV